MSPGSAPEVSELITARRTDGDLPASPEDEAWDGIAPSYVPLVGQVIETPRQFAPAVDGAWVRAAHDGEELAVLIQWNDPSASPDPAWDDWQTRIAPVVPADGSPPAADAAMSDGLAIQFPAAVPDGMERPYFLMGDAASPVYLWHWESEAGFSGRWYS